MHAYPQLIEVLLEAHVYLQKYFGPDLEGRFDFNLEFV